MDLSGLNERQREAVLQTEGPVLVLAGAGSGKTRALTTRAAYLIERGVAPWNILAITFTNKAAAEMRQRIEALVPDAQDMWVSTFHAMCARLLRMEGERLGYARGFSIYDAEDALTVVKECLKELDIDKDLIDPRGARSAISRAKNDGVSPAQYRQVYGEGDNVKLTARVYARYEDKLRQSNAMDFDDLLLKTLLLFDEYPEVLEKYQRRFRYIMVDEYQDTNAVQYRIVKMLAKGHGNIFVVGDDDQSIYGWRGADISNILDFEKDFPGACVIRLEQNYRSHQGILDAANGVIRHNRSRMGKELWSAVRTGQKPLEFQAESDLEEAQFVAEKVASLLREGKYSATDIAVLYRMNSQSRVLENKLKERGIPYAIYGGQSFYERKEIKDVLAYLNLLVNPSADLCFMRAVQVPRRGIGEVSLGKLYAAAQERRVSLMRMCREADEILPKRTADALKAFADMLEGIAAGMEERTLLQTVELVVERSGLRAALMTDTSAEGRMRVLNVEEFLRSVSDFEREAGEGASLEAFLERNALISDVDAVGEEDGKIMLMTLHSAKGLEFPVVFIVGMQEGLLPHQISLMEGDVEEERRLCYVGMTRAKKRLYLTWSSSRLIRTGAGFERVEAKRSRFLSEIPGGCIEPAGVKRHAPSYASREPESHSPYSFASGRVQMPKAAAPKSKAQHAPDEFVAGRVVTHPKFGRGQILSTNGEGDEKIAVVRFDTAGEKKMFVAFAPLKIE
jgi:DNA helicase-2/ATP-dependent DNA helicase PcrA